MRKKTVFLIVGILLVILVAVTVVLVLKKNNGLDNSNKNASSNSQGVNPELELSYEIEGGIATIYANAKIENDDSVLEIYLPDGKIEKGNTAKYEVDRAGEYEFKVIASNGTSITKTIIIEDLEGVSSDNPYIPDGFTHISGTTVETGYVIKDENGNEYVWVPVESGILTRNTDGDDQYEESDSSASGLYNSVAKYYGFYIARYEASQTTFEGNTTVASVPNALPWTNINYEDAYNVSRNAWNIYEYSSVRTALINSYAWDSTLSWLNKSETNYSSNTSYGNYSGTILNTGSTETDKVNSICDMAGNVREWTTEIYYPETDLSSDENMIENITSEETDNSLNSNEVINTNNQDYRVIRGGSANINRVAGSHIGQQENMTDAYWGFRIILYKN